jgi:hypothetical protein
MFKRVAFSNIGIIEEENAKELLAVSSNKEVLSFKYDPENFVYFRCRAITADVPNKNGDLFPEEEIIKSYKTFIGVGVYKDHDANSVNKAVGKILWADYIPEGKYVELIGCIDKKLDPDLARRVQTGIIDSCSMGCVVKEAECSICHNVARNPNQLCRHMHPTYGIKGSLDANGNIVYEINRGIQFTELSLVTSPADNTAKLFEVIASFRRKSQGRDEPSILDVSWFRDIKNYINDKLSKTYDLLEKIANIAPRNDKEKQATITARKLIDLYTKIGIFKQPIDEKKFKEMVYNLFYFADHRIHDLMSFYVKMETKQKRKETELSKNINEVINAGKEIYNAFIEFVEYLKSLKNDPNLKYAILYSLLNNLYFPTFPSKFKREIGISSILDIFSDISRLVKGYNLDAFSFPIHILKEPFDPNVDVDIYKIATKEEQSFLSTIPIEYQKYALSLIRATSYYNAMGLIRKIGVDNFVKDYENVFGTKLDKEKVKYLLENQKDIINIYNKLTGNAPKVGSEILKIFRHQEDAFNHISNAALLLRSVVLSKYENKPKHEFLQRFVYGNLTEEDLKNENLIFLKKNYEYIEDPEVIKLLHILTNYDVNIYKTIHLVWDKKRILNFMDILEKPLAFLNYTKFISVLKQDDYIRKIFDENKGIIIGNKVIKSTTQDEIINNYSKLKLFKSQLSEQRYDALVKELEKFTPFMDLYNEFLTYVNKTIKEIIQKGLNAQIGSFEEFGQMMSLSGFRKEKVKAQHIYEKISKIIDLFNSIKARLSIEKKELDELIYEIVNEIKLLRSAIEKEQYGIYEKYEKDFDKELNKIYNRIKSSINSIIVQYHFNLLPNFKEIENKLLNVENKIKEVIENYKREKETTKTIEGIMILNRKFYDSYYKSILQEFVLFLNELGEYVTEDFLKMKNEKLIKRDLKELYEKIKSFILDVKGIIKIAKIEFKYIKGFGFRTSLIEAKQGDKYVIKRLSDIMPREVMIELLNGNENIISPDEIIQQLSKVVNNLEEFENFFQINNEKNVVGDRGTPNEA